MDWEGPQGWIIASVLSLGMIAGVYALSQQLGKPAPRTYISPAEIQQPAEMYQKSSANLLDAAVDAGIQNHVYK